MSQLPPGTLVETDELVGLSVGDNMLAVLNSDVFEDGSIVYLKERGPNDWIITNDEIGAPYDSGRGWWISYDWNGVVKSREFDAYGDDCDDWDGDDGHIHWSDYEINLDRHQDYDY